MTEFRIRDPFVLVDNDKYYMYASGCDCIRGKCDNFIVYESDDLINWSEPKVIFKADEDFWSHEDYWAPEVHKYNGKYYMFATLKGETRATQIFCCDTPDGMFYPISNEPITPLGWECLDGTFYIDKKGKPYVIFCHEWTQVIDGEMCYMELSDDLTKAVSEPRLMFKGSDPSWSIPADLKKGTYVTDGPFLHRTQSGNLLLIWSSCSKTGYTTGIAVSSNGEIDGEWIHTDEPLFRDNGGHGMIFEDLNGRLLAALHKPNTPYGMERAVFLELEDTGDVIKVK